MDLGNPKNTIEVIQKYNFAFQKKFGQNFLIDSNILDNIAACAGVTKEDCVLEIGPGAGSMTKYLCDAAHHVLSIELDERLIPLLTAFLAERDNFTLVQGDVMTLNLADVTKNLRKPLSVVANIPYYITTPLLTMLLASPIPIQRMALMVQKEVAQRIAAKPGTPDYSAFTVFCQYYAEPELLFDVPASCFIPQPKVTSSVIRLDCRVSPPVEVKSEAMFMRVVKAAFAQRRKTLLNALSAGFGEMSKETVEKCLTDSGFDPKVRGEVLSIGEFAKIADAFFTVLD